MLHVTMPIPVPYGTRTVPSPMAYAMAIVKPNNKKYMPGLFDNTLIKPKLQIKVRIVKVNISVAVPFECYVPYPVPWLS